jgi:hypothetical protein
MAAHKQFGKASTAAETVGMVEPRRQVHHGMQRHGPPSVGQQHLQTCKKRSAVCNAVGSSSQVAVMPQVVEWSLGIVGLSTAKPSLVGNDAVRASKALGQMLQIHLPGPKK